MGATIGCQPLLFSLYIYEKKCQKIFKKNVKNALHFLQNEL